MTEPDVQLESGRAQGAGVTEVSDVTVTALVSLVGTADAPPIVDVREPDEFEAWSIPGARNVPLSKLEAPGGEGFALAGDGVDPDRRLVVVCASGARSARATALLRAAGLLAVNLSGGMRAWATVYDTASASAGPVEIVQVRRRGKGCLSYVVGADGEAVVVDPSADVERYRAVAGDRGWRITRVVDTHLHADHLSGARALADASGAALHRGAGDAVAYPYEPLPDGATVPVGSARLVVRASPGHTAGSIVLEAPDGSLLTGDTLFVDGVGRPDLADRAEADAALLYDSLVRLTGGRTGATPVFPAHFGAGVVVRPGEPVAASLDEIRARVPQLSWERDRFVQWASGRAAARPPRFQEIVRLNAGDGDPSLPESRELELGPNRCAAA